MTAPRTELPSPFIRGIAGALACASPNRPDKLRLYLPQSWVPMRRYATFHVSFGAYGLLQIDVLHEEPFTKATPGRNAWQTTQSVNWADFDNLHHCFSSVPVRMIERKFDQIYGDPDAVRALQEKLSFSPRNRAAELAVRVTPEGFQFLLRPPAGIATASETRDFRLLTTMASLSWRRALQEAIITHPRHGHKSIAAWANRAYPEDFHDNDTNPNAARCSNSKETTDMTKTDLTTADNLPFGLIANEAIVRCEFESSSGRDYAYFAGGLKLVEGDYVVVASPHGSGGVFDEESGGYLTVVRVVSVDPNAESIRKAAKWVISKVDVTGYRERRQMVERLKALDEQIRVAEREARKLLELEQLRTLSPTLAQLIDARSQLTGVATSAMSAEAISTVAVAALATAAPVVNGTEEEAGNTKL